MLGAGLVAFRADTAELVRRPNPMVGPRLLLTDGAEWLTVGGFAVGGVETLGAVTVGLGLVLEGDGVTSP